MWDQYADNYNGICIAFSKKNIISRNNKKFHLFEKNINYLTFRELSNNKVGDINGNLLTKIGKEEYKKKIKTELEKSFFLKHKDYSGENEYRIGTYYDKKKCSFEIIKNEIVYDKILMLDVKECIKAIFISSYNNDRQKTVLLEYADKLNIPIIEMIWKHNSFETRDYRKWITYINEIAEKLKKEESTNA